MPGTAVFLTSSPNATPNALLHSLKHYKVLHEQNVFLTVEFLDVPWVPAARRVASERLADDCWRVTARYGFMERPDVVLALEHCAPGGLQVEPMEVTYFLSREKIVPGTSAKRHGAMARPGLRGDGAQRRERHRLLQHPDQPGGRTGYAGRDLTCGEAPPARA